MFQRQSKIESFSKIVRVGNGSVNSAGAKCLKENEIRAGGVRSRTGVEIKSIDVMVLFVRAGRESYIDGGSCKGGGSSVSENEMGGDFGF